MVFRSRTGNFLYILIIGGLLVVIIQTPTQTQQLVKTPALEAVMIEKQLL